MRKTVAVCAAALFMGAAALLAGCGEKAAPPPPVDTAAKASPASAMANAVAHPARPAGDRAQDKRRKPLAALSFFGVNRGMSVFEIEAGPGWYTELLSRAVGAEGTVVMQNFPGFRSFAGEQIEARLAGGRLANVRESVSRFDALDAEDESVDLVTWVQGPHELFYRPASGEFFGAPAAAYAEIFRILKPGGAFVVIDHAAKEGAPETAGNDLHRIDKALVIAAAARAGFALEAESDFLANPDDALDLNVFDPAIRGRTDQFALRFRKPD